MQIACLFCYALSVITPSFTGGIEYLGKDKTGELKASRRLRQKEAFDIMEAV